MQCLGSSLLYSVVSVVYLVRAVCHVFMYTLKALPECKSRGTLFLIIIMGICKAPTPRLKALNK